MYDKKFYDDNKLETFWYETCTYDDEKWQVLNTVDPTYGVYFDNLIKEERQMRFSEFYVQPQWDFKLRENPKDSIKEIDRITGLPKQIENFVGYENKIGKISQKINENEIKKSSENKDNNNSSINENKKLDFISKEKTKEIKSK